MPERVLIAPEASLAYNTKLDIQAYQDLPASKLNSLNQLTRFNVETSIGERFNVELFQTTYYLEDNLIKHPLYEEPFIERVKLGQKFRQQKGSTDIEREIAEVVGFEKIQRILTETVTDEAKVISISPRGTSSSIYQHNFFDVYQKNPDGTITMSRFTSKLTHDEFYQAAQKLDPFNDICQNPSDADFLANPLITYKSASEILEIMHPQEETMSRPEYQKLLEACTPLILNYIRTLEENPNEFLADKNYNAILKFADVATGFDQQITGVQDRQSIIRSISRPHELASTVNYLAAQTIRRVATACGQSGNSQGSFSFAGLFRPFSVAEFAIGRSGCADCGGSEDHFHCPGCGGQITSGLGITQCPHCSLTKEQAGSKC